MSIFNFNFINSLLIKIGFKKPQNKIIIEAGGKIKIGPRARIKGFQDAELRSLKDVDHRGKIDSD